MLYLLPAAIAAMLAYMFWLAVFRMRRDRVMSERELSRGKFAFRPRERVRFLLNRSFSLSNDRPEWEEPLVSRLDEIRPQPVSDDPRRVSPTDAPPG